MKQWIKNISWGQNQSWTRVVSGLTRLPLCKAIITSNHHAIRLSTAVKLHSNIIFCYAKLHKRPWKQFADHKLRRKSCKLECRTSAKRFTKQKAISTIQVHQPSRALRESWKICAHRHENGIKSLPNNFIFEKSQVWLMAMIFLCIESLFVRSLAKCCHPRWWCNLKPSVGSMRLWVI